ncbi:MAG TPA: hypothetical protein VNS58_13635 [Puia sp.]|nr:hypothetical protein [Puia sp.]
MKKYSFLFAAIFAMLLFSCKKEAAPVVSANVADPFIRVDNPSSEVDHQIYLIYQQSAVPVLYTDTLTKTPLTLLDPGYHLTSLDSFLTIRYLTDSAAILVGVNFIKDQILPSLSGKLKPYSMLLADSLYTFKSSYRGRVKVILNAYLGWNTVVIGNVGAIPGLGPDSLISYKKDVFKSIVTVPLNQDTNLLHNFYAVTAPYYGKYAYGDGSIPGYIAYAPKETYGALSDGTESSYYYQMPDQATDLSEFLDKVLTMSEQDFATQYAAYPLVLSKYGFLRAALIQIGFKFS